MKTLSPLKRRLLVLLLFCPLAGAVRASVPEPGDPSTNWLNFWSFTDTTNWVSNLGYSPVAFTNLSSSPLGNGDALVLDSTNAAWLLYNVVESDSHTNLTVDRGTIVFWFAPRWASTNEGGSGPGDWGRLIEVGSYTTNASYGWFSIYLDPEAANLYFASQTNNGSGSVWLSSPIAWTSNRWHHVALTYSQTNATLYLDGELATNGLPVTNWPGADVLTNGFFIGSDSDTGLAQARGMFDDVATYKVPLAGEEIYLRYIQSSVIYLLNVENSGNFSSAPFTPSFDPGFVAVTGSGWLDCVVTNADCVTNSEVWLTNVTATAASNAMIATFTIAGGSNNVAYDVFATAALLSPVTNTVWAWMGQGQHCRTYRLTNLPPDSAYLILGKPQDSDQDGLTDAYEKLSSKTNPNDDDSDDDGVMDGWEVVYRDDPKNQDSDGDGVIDQMFAVIVTRPGSTSTLP